MGTQYSGTDLSEFEVGGDGQDDLFDVLSHPHRRFMLHFLQGSEMPVLVAELSAELAAWETQRSDSDRRADSSDAIETSLVHNHLPMMAQVGLITYDVAGQTVTLADQSEEARAHLQAMASY